MLQHGRLFFVYSSNKAAVTSCEHTLFFSFVNFLGQMMILISSLILVCPSSVLPFTHFPFRSFGSNFNFMSFCIYFSLSLPLPPSGNSLRNTALHFNEFPLSSKTHWCCFPLPVICELTIQLQFPNNLLWKLRERHRHYLQNSFINSKIISHNRTKRNQDNSFVTRPLHELFQFVW